MKELIEDFCLQLQDNGFEPDENRAIWAGQVHVEWKDSDTGKWNSVNHLIKIYLPTGFPFNAPVVVSADIPPLGPSWHLNPGEIPTLCLWDRNEDWQPSFSARKTLNRIHDWFYYYHTDTWPLNSQVPDLHVYLEKISASVIGELWHPSTDRECGRFKLWFSPKYFKISPVIASTDEAILEPEDRLGKILLKNERESEIGIWFRVPKPFVPSKDLRILFKTVDQLLSKEESWAFTQTVKLVGRRRKYKGGGFPIAIAYPDHTQSERYLFLWVQFPKNRKSKFNWSTTENLPLVTIHSFQTALAAKADLLRRTAHISKNLINCTAAIFGIGALGSSVALLLAKAGINELRLVDSDNIMPGNVVRHMCGLSWVNFPKTRATQSVISAHNPDCLVKCYEQSWQTDELTQFLTGANLVIDTTGNSNFSHHLNRFCINRSQSLLTAAAYRRAKVGRILIWRNSSDPCIGCYTLNPDKWSDDDYPVIPFNPEERFIEDGCGSVTEEAAALDVEAVANFVARTAVKVLRNEFRTDNIGLRINEPLPEVTRPVFQSAGVHWWQNRPIENCPLCKSKAK